MCATQVNLAFDSLAHVNNDGKIRWGEFIHWIMDPNATKTTNAEGTALGAFNYKDLLRPLFELYDGVNTNSTAKQ